MKAMFFFLILSMPLIVSAQKIDSLKICDLVIKKFDEFTNETEFSSDPISPLRLIKTVGKTYYSTSLYLTTSGSIPAVMKQGVIIIFTDGTRINKNSDISCAVRSGGFSYSSLVGLTNEELEQLKSKKIKKFRLFIFDNEISDSQATQFKEITKCISNMK